MAGNPDQGQIYRIKKVGSNGDALIVLNDGGKCYVGGVPDDLNKKKTYIEIQNREPGKRGFQRAEYNPTVTQEDIAKRLEAESKKPKIVPLNKDIPDRPKPRPPLCSKDKIINLSIKRTYTKKLVENF